MKVLIISNMYPNRNSIFGIFIKRQIEDLEKKGVEILKVVKKDSSVIAYIIFILQSIYYIVFKSYDIIHAHYGFHSGLVPAIFKKKPLITTYHGSDALVEPFRNKLYYMMQNYTLISSDHIIAVSNDIKNVLINTFKVHPEKITVISCGVDTEIFCHIEKNEARKELGIKTDAKIVLFVGRLSPLKGVDVLYRCAERMPEVIFIFLGEGGMRTDSKNCIIAGSRPNTEIPLWMNSADVLVLPSRTEGTPVVLLEALSCGTPVISSDVGGCPDIVIEGKTGYLLKSINILILQKIINDIIYNDETIIKMRQESIRFIKDNYDSGIIANKIIHLYNRQ